MNPFYYSLMLIALTFVYFLCESISTFDTRIIQAKKAGYLHEKAAKVPDWTGLFGILGWITFLVLLILNWKYAILLFVIKFILKVLPVLENIGAFLLLPVVGKEIALSVNIIAREQKKATKTLEALQNSNDNNSK